MKKTDKFNIKHKKVYNWCEKVIPMYMNPEVLGNFVDSKNKQLLLKMDLKV